MHKRNADGNMLDSEQVDAGITPEQAADMGACDYLMRTPEGRRVAWHILSAAGVFRLSFTGDSAQTFFREGRRSIGLELMALLTTYHPHGYQQMITENAVERRTPSE